MSNSQRRISITDFIIEAAIPILIIGLIWSLVTFAITVKGVFYPGQEATLTNVFFLYVMGAVMANRLGGLYGESDKAAIYSIILVSVMALFALTFSAWYGAIFGGMDAGEGSWVNLLIVGVVGAASYALCRESCFDIKDNGEAKTDLKTKAELRAKQDWYRREIEAEESKNMPKEEKEEPPPELPKRPPGIWTMYFSALSMVVFAIGQRLLPEDNGELYIRAIHLLIANLACALALLLFTNLAALRFRCWQKKTQPPSGVGTFWTVAGGATILIVLALASLPPRPVPKYLVKSAAEEPASGNETDEEFQSRSTDTWGGETKKIEMRLEKEERDKVDLAKEFADQKSEEGAGTEESKDTQQQHDGSSTASQSGEQGSSSREEPEHKQQQNGGSSTASQSGSQGGSSERKSSSRSTQAQKPPAASPPRPPAPAMPLQGLEIIGKVVFFILLIVCAMVALIKILSFFAGAHIAGGIKNALQQFANVLRRLLLRPKIIILPKRKLRSILERANLHLENPFGEQRLLDKMSNAELVRYTYRAFENYAHIHGYTPGNGQTPREFIETLPHDFHMPEIQTLLKLFMLVEYSHHTVRNDEVSQLRNIWARIEA